MKTLIFFLASCLFSTITFSQNADSANFYYNKGLKAKTDGLFAIAAKDFETAVDFNPAFTEAYIANGETNLSMRAISKAQANFNKAFQLQPGNTEVIRHLTTLYFNNHQYQKAVEFAEKCKDWDTAQRISGMSYYHLEDYGKVEKYLTGYLNNNSTDAEALYTLAQTYIELENEKAAIDAMEKAVGLNAGRSAWLYELGMMYYSQNDFKKALTYFELAAQNGYNKTNAFYENYGFAQLYSGDTENGIKTLNIVLEKKPNNKELLNNMAHAMYDTQKYKDALDYFTKILNLDPKDAVTLYMAGMTFQKLGQKEKGQKICDHAIEMDPSLAKYRQKNQMPMGL
ncbi:MAG: tetratricopeptide repeat protein [Ginsengibacter sp.]